VVTGANRDDVGLLIIPRIDSCRARAGLPEGTALAEVLAAPPMRGFFQQLVDRLFAEGTGSATRIARALVLVEPPNIDRGEITDKGSINQRAVLTERAALVDALYEADPNARDADVLLARK
ncbi:MAG: feruloyl-CoA synthase, partial [Burkholderiaceae bacterium]|nr:feruloyl-CoA synthase [Burkholderiaceae bacterium]